MVVKLVLDVGLRGEQAFHVLLLPGQHGGNNDDLCHLASALQHGGDNDDLFHLASALQHGGDNDDLYHLASALQQLFITQTTQLRLI